MNIRVQAYILYSQEDEECMVIFIGSEEKRAQENSQKKYFSKIVFFLKLNKNFLNRLF